MNLIDNYGVLQEREHLNNAFQSHAMELLPVWENCKHKVSEWEYSLGITRDLIPYERLVPSINAKEGKVLKKPTATNMLSKQLVSAGFDECGDLIILKKKYDKDIETYGENIRFLTTFDGEQFLYNARIYESNPANNKLMSVCQIYQKDNFVFYLSVTPPRDWFIRVDEIKEGKVGRSSLFATSWVKQIDYDYIYNAEGELSKIMIGDVVHWKNM